MPISSLPCRHPRVCLSTCGGFQVDLSPRSAHWPCRGGLGVQPPPPWEWDTTGWRPAEEAWTGCHAGHTSQPPTTSDRRLAQVRLSGEGP